MLDTRKLYIERAYSSLYEYLTQELGYSGSATMRRIEAARLLRAVPAIAEKIQKGALNLSQIGELSRSIKDKERSTGVKVTELQKEELVFKIAGKTTLETQKELAQALDIPVKDFEKQKMQKDESLRLELTLSKEQYQKLLACRDLAAHLLGQNQSDSSWASVFEVLADQYLTKKISARTKNKNEGKSTTASVSHTVNKTVTPKTRQWILQRDTCCQYKDPQTGRQCRSTFGLQIDHRTSQWVGGDHRPENLQLMCGQHNRFKYRKEASLK